MKPFFALALLFTLPATLAAQRTGSAHFGGGFANFPGHFSHRGNPRGGYYPLGLFDPFYADYLSDGYSSSSSQPSVIFMQPPGSPAAPEPPRPPAQPLMIELQGDRYVQISGDGPSRSQMMIPSESQNLSRPALLSRSQPDSAVLIFRDGHRQEISSYTITDGILYASADFAATGAWNQKIALSSLNVPETVASNSSRGLHFQLPSAPNEVIVGP